MPRPVVTLLATALALAVLTWTANLAVLYLGVLHSASYWQEPRGATGGLLYVALGDSAAQGVGASRPSRGYVALLADRLRRETSRPVQVVNLSRSGATARDVVEEQLPALLLLQPDVVTVGIGGNDVRDYDPAAFEAAVAALVDGLPAGTVIADAPWFMHGHWERDALHASGVLTRNAERRRLVVAPLHARQSGEGRWSMLTEFAADLFHPNDRGHEVWAEAFWSRLRDAPAVRLT